MPLPGADVRSVLEQIKNKYCLTLQEHVAIEVAQGRLDDSCALSDVECPAHRRDTDRDEAVCEGDAEDGLAKGGPVVGLEALGDDVLLILTKQLSLTNLHGIEQVSRTLNRIVRARWFDLVQDDPLYKVVSVHTEVWDASLRTASETGWGKTLHAAGAARLMFVKVFAYEHARRLLLNEGANECARPERQLLSTNRQAMYFTYFTEWVFSFELYETRRVRRRVEKTKLERVLLSSGEDDCGLVELLERETLGELGDVLFASDDTIYLVLRLSMKGHAQSRLLYDGIFHKGSTSCTNRKHVLQSDLLEGEHKIYLYGGKSEYGGDENVLYETWLFDRVVDSKEHYRRRNGTLLSDEESSSEGMDDA